MQKRATILDSVRNNPDIDVLIIGGGINGVGTFRDLAAQGVNVLLVERDDFCSGASAASSHMLHGGIRYLENGEFRLVREALKERNLMLRNAPHYAKPLPTTIPIFKWFSGILNAPLKFLRLMNRPGERGALVIKIGLMMYDWYTRGDDVMPNHTFRLRGKAIRQHPEINLDIVCTATYYDAWMPSPERITMELVLDAETLHPGAMALNYAPVIGKKDSRTVVFQDDLTGETYEVRPKVVVNAAGPWIDFVNEAMEEKTQFIGGTKGSHLILDYDELYIATNGTEMFFENDDGRIVLILPYVDGKVMVGTTDIRIDNPDEAVCTEDEIDYILSMIPKVFPRLKADRSHIIFQFSGVRPLENAAASYTGNVSRDHSIRTIEPGKGVDFPVYSLVGGKWTSFRAFSEQTTDVVLRALNQTRRTHTDHMAIGGGRDYPDSDSARDYLLKIFHDQTKLPIERLQQLFDRYGTRARDVAVYCAQGDDNPLQHKPDFTRREILFLIAHEKALRIDDIALRRSLIAWVGQLNTALLNELADILGEALGWSADTKAKEIERTVTIMRKKHGVTHLSAEPVSN